MNFCSPLCLPEDLNKNKCEIFQDVQSLDKREEEICAPGVGTMACI